MVFVWDGDQLVLELSESGKVQKRYIRGNDLVYADKGENTEKQYYVTDPHGNVVQLTDESGKVTKAYEYDSFGNEVKPDGKDDNPFRYCGEYYDKETEEVYLRARYYQPAVGRFLTRDIYTGEEDEPLSLHLYAYCVNDGINSIDPNGQSPVAVWTSSAWWLCGLDGPFPIGDIVYVAGIAVSGAASAVIAKNVAKTVVVPVPQKRTKAERIEKSEIKTIVKAAVQIKKKTKRQKKKYFELHMSKLPKSKEMYAKIGRSITKANAILRLKGQKSTITWFSYNARQIASIADNGRVPRHHNKESDMKGEKGYPKFRHYHPHSKSSHSAYLVV